MTSLSLSLSKTIKATDIATVRKLAKPPYLITLIMDCVLILFGRRLEPVKPDYDHQFLVPSWSESLKVTLRHSFPFGDARLRA